jgi:hypothetical protein
MLLRSIVLALPAAALLFGGGAAVARQFKNQGKVVFEDD